MKKYILPLAFALTAAGSAYPESLNKQVRNAVAEDFEARIKRHEGRRDTAYNCSEGKRTIGYGFNLDRTDARQKIEDLGLNFSDVYSGRAKLTEAQMQYLFECDFMNSQLAGERAIGKNYSKLANPAREVLTEMAYQLGEAGLKGFRNFRRALQTPDYQKAAQQMKNSKWARQTPNRAKELSRKMAGCKKK